jgi:predicted phage-related endonuclease
MTATPTPLDADHVVADAIAQMKRIRTERKVLDEQEKALGDLLKNKLAEFGDNVIVFVGGEKAATYTEVTSRRVDSKRLKAEYPEVAEAVTTESTSRRLTLAGDA